MLVAPTQIRASRLSGDYFMFHIKSIFTDRYSSHVVTLMAVLAVVRDKKFKFYGMNGLSWRAAERPPKNISPLY